jgi:hypothetical protein
MSKDITINDTELKAFIDKLSSIELEGVMNTALDELGNRFVQKVKSRTPVGKTGLLKNNWKMENSERSKSGSVYMLALINPTAYAEYVENGHMQDVGRYVPALGKRLVAPWVEGQFFTAKSEAEMQRIAGPAVRKCIEEQVKEIINV